MFNLYGFFISLGILVGVFVAEKLKKQSPITNHQSPISFFDILPWVLIPAVVGARIYHVIDYWEYYAENLWEIFYIWQGGLGIFGGIIGGIIGLWRFLKFKKFNGLKFNQAFLSLLDFGVIGLSIGQAIGRWGNYFNQELYGLPTVLPWGIFIRTENRLAGYENFTHFHPLFLYESIGCFIIFLILITNYSLLITKKKTGTAFFLYLFLYSFFRFWLEFLRIEGWVVRLPLIIKLIRVNQLVTLGLMIVSGHFLWKRSSYPVIGRA